jgi:hypothetical protein
MSEVCLVGRRSQFDLQGNWLSVAILCWRFERVEAGAAAEGFVEGAAEMAEAVVADGEGRFGDVALACTEEFGGAFHADLADVLLDGDAGFLREQAA